jgi:hypothetical protein
MRVAAWDRRCTGTHIAYMGLERGMNCRRPMSTLSVAWEKSGGTSQMAGDMIALCTCGGAIFPFASEAEVIGALPANVVVAKMIVKRLGVGEGFGAFEPLTVVER